MSERSGVTEPGRLYFLVALPQAGKSLWANQWVKEVLQQPITWLSAEFTQYYGDGIVIPPACLNLFEKKEPLPPPKPRAIVAGDDFRHAIHGREYLVEAEGLVFASMDIAARALLRRGFDVIIDETCTTQSTLLRYLKIDINAFPIFIDTPAEVCAARAVAAGRDYLLGPISRMDAQLRALRADWDNIVAKLKEYIELRKGNDVAV